MQRTYAIGDVHGRDDLLGDLLDEIGRRSDEELPRLIFLGDIVDRGPGSRNALELVDSALAKYPGSALVLGNHDERFIHGIARYLHPAVLNHWLDEFGGWDTVASYFDGEMPTFSRFEDEVYESYGHHVDLLWNAVSMVETERHCFVHAGIRPGVPLAKQDRGDLLWIREGFLDHLEPLRR